MVQIRSIRKLLVHMCTSLCSRVKLETTENDVYVNFDWFINHHNVINYSVGNKSLDDVNPILIKFIAW